MTTHKKPELDGPETKLTKLLLEVARFINPGSPSELRYTGGWVRDKILGINSNDIDVAINNMKGEPYFLRLQEYLGLPGNITKHELESIPKLYRIAANVEKSKHLETVTTTIFGLDVDFVNLRKETYTDEHGRFPQEEFGTPEEDALRRDATINAMFYNLQTEQIEDFTHHGMDDLAHRIIRTPLEPYQTFKDDPLRVLRLIRFASRLSFEIDDESKAAMQHEDIRQALMVKISRERVLQELEKMLKGHDPRSALALIDEMRLYDTIFTDPTQDLHYSPETQLWRTSYELLDDLLNDKHYHDIQQILFPDCEARYTGWFLTAFIPWFDAPMISTGLGGKKQLLAAISVAREGIKAPGKFCDILDLSIRNARDISSLKNQFIQHENFSREAASDEHEPIARDTLGMAIRRWGTSWRSQALYSLMLEVVDNDRKADQRLESWSRFLMYIRSLDLLTAYDFKPVIDGKQLAKALDARPGPWMKDALDVVMAWQLRNPDTATTDGAIEAVRNNQGEITAVLIRHFLQLTIRPLFAKTQTQRNITAQGRKVMDSSLNLSKNHDMIDDDDINAKLWKTSKESYALNLLSWVVNSLDGSSTQEHWPLLIPPILTLLDDTDTQYKRIGCELVTELLNATPPSLLARTGLGEVFQQAIEPCLSYLPTLTPEQESVELLDAAYPAMLALGTTSFPDWFPSQSSSSSFADFLLKLLHSHLLTSISHVSESYPDLTATLLSHLKSVLGYLRTDTISQLCYLLPLLSSLMTMPFIAATPGVLLQAAKVLQTIIGFAWPRMWFWHGEVLNALCKAKVAVVEEKQQWLDTDEGQEPSTRREMLEQLEAVEEELRLATLLLMEALDMDIGEDEAMSEGYSAIDVQSLIRSLVEADPVLVQLFSATSAQSTSFGSTT